MNKTVKKGTYPGEIRQEAIQLYPKHGARKTAEMVGMSESYVNYLATKAGLRSVGDRRSRRRIDARDFEW